jgi:putative YjhG/YagF family dehydratase
MALAAQHDMPCVLVPGGVTLLAEDGEDAGKVQTIGARFSHGQITLEEAADMGCRACASPGGGCQFLGTAATAQVVAEALGMTLPHSALAPSGHPIWLDMAKRSGRAVLELGKLGWTMSTLLTDAALENAMVTHAAFGGSTNLILHIPAVAHQAGLRRPTVDDWSRINKLVPRLVDALPNGPRNHPTVQVFLAGAVPEVMLHLRKMGLLNLQAKTAAGGTLDDSLNWWEQSERRAELHKVLRDRDGVDPNNVIFPADTARQRGIGSTVCFPTGNLSPDGSVIKSTSIDPTVIDADNVYRNRGPAKVFTSEPAAIRAIKEGKIEAGDIMVLMSRGPMGSGMEETYQVTSGHVSPEALAGGPVGRLRDGDTIEIIIDRNSLEGHVNLLGEDGTVASGTALLADREPHPGIQPDPLLPKDTRLWGLLQDVSGGPWGGCVYDVDAIAAALEAGREALRRKA